ncbi:FkbM family methyltransferase [Ekhidna sp.]|uniref:FkbM family methyltransferase n=1 Tax=Ekhidna sp. TaxID=2608089 RepID=UPI0032981E80
MIKLNLDQKEIKIETNQTSYLTQLVFWNSPLSFEYTPIFIELSKRISCFWDIGANIGYYSLIASSVNPEVEVVAFEPAPEPLHFLKKNVELNSLNIQVSSLALSDKEGEIVFYEVKNKKYTYLKYNLAGEGNTGSLTEGRNFSKTLVETTTIDKFHEGFKKPIDLIKIDTEGTEHLILANASKVINQFKPIIICETLFNKIEKDLEKVMLGFGYEFYNHSGAGLKKVDSIIRNVDDGILNCFFVHPQKKNLIQDFII